MLARVLAMALCLSVCVCRFSIETSTYPTLYYKEIQVRLKRCTSLCNFAPNSGLRKFRHGISIVEACYQLGLRQVDAQSVINWDVVGQLTGQYLRAPTLDHCSLSHRSSSSVYTTRRVRRVGLLATDVAARFTRRWRNFYQPTPEPRLTTRQTVTMAVCKVECWKYASGK